MHELTTEPPKQADSAVTARGQVAAAIHAFLSSDWTAISTNLTDALASLAATAADAATRRPNAVLDGADAFMNALRNANAHLLAGDAEAAVPLLSAALACVPLLEETAKREESRATTLAPPAGIAAAAEVMRTVDYDTDCEVHARYWGISIRNIAERMAAELKALEESCSETLQPIRARLNEFQVVADALRDEGNLPGSIDPVRITRRIVEARVGKAIAVGAHENCRAQQQSRGPKKTSPPLPAPRPSAAVPALSDIPFPTLEELDPSEFPELKIQ